MVDYQGQRLSENIYNVIIVLFGICGWIYGYMEEDFKVAIKVWAVGTVLALLVSLFAILSFSFILKFQYSYAFLIGQCIIEIKCFG